LVCELGQENLWENLQNKTQVLALITPCKTKGEDASIVHIQYKDSAASIVTDIRNVKAVVGHAQTRQKWGVIDRSNGLAHTAFVTDSEDFDNV
jgi:hypothetical protein